MKWRSVPIERTLGIPADFTTHNPLVPSSTLGAHQINRRVTGNCACNPFCFPALEIQHSTCQDLANLNSRLWLSLTSHSGIARLAASISLPQTSKPHSRHARVQHRACRYTDFSAKSIADSQHVGKQYFTASIFRTYNLARHSYKAIFHREAAGGLFPLLIKPSSSR